MSSIVDEIRNYVKERDTVTLREVVDYIVNKKKINTTETYVYQTLSIVLLQQHKTLHKETLISIIRKYVKEHGNKVSNEEVIAYVKKYKNANENSIRHTLKRVLDENNGTLRHKGVTQLVKDYIETTEDPNLDSAIIYVRKKDNKAKVTAIKGAWFRIKA